MLFSPRSVLGLVATVSIVLPVASAWNITFYENHDCTYNRHEHYLQYSGNSWDQCNLASTPGQYCEWEMKDETGLFSNLLYCTRMKSLLIVLQ